MKSKVLKQDRQDLIKISQSLSGQERLLAFLNHNQLLAQFSLNKNIKRNKHENNRSRTIRSTFG